MSDGEAGNADPGGAWGTLDGYGLRCAGGKRERRSRVDLEIARVYSGLVSDADMRIRVFAMLEDEFLRSRQMILQVTGQRELLGNNRVLARSIQLRNPYVDPMSLIQVELLRRKQRDPNRADLDFPLGATINGIAAGLHNTG